MRAKILAITGLGLGMMGMSAISVADITYFEVADWQVYNQTSVTTTNFSYDLFTARVFSNTANEIVGGNVIDPNSNLLHMTGQGPYVIGYSDTASDLTSLNAAHPYGNYTFNLTAGSLDGAVDHVSLIDTGWSSATPGLDAASYMALTTSNPNQSISLNWGNWSPVGGTQTSTQTYFYLYDLTAGTQLVARQDTPGNLTGYTLAANTLVAGDQYEYILNYGNLNQYYSSGGFAPGVATSADYKSTYGIFTAVPEPSAGLVLLPCALFLISRRRR